MTLTLDYISHVITLTPSIFKLVLFNTGGYGVYCFNTLIEADYSLTPIIKEDDILVYKGPLQLYIQDDNKELRPIKFETNSPIIEPNYEWIGIDSERFLPYRKWINKDGTCGMYTAAVLLAYYKDYIEQNIVTESLYPYQSGNGERLIMAMKVYIKSLAIRGTIAYDISFGINRFFREYQTNSKLGYKIKAISNISATFGIVSTRLSSKIPKPVIVGLYSWLGSPKNYKNHWVVAYAYCEDGDNRYYKVHDNHGRHSAIVNVSWTIGSIRLSRAML